MKTPIETFRAAVEEEAHKHTLEADCKLSISREFAKRIIALSVDAITGEEEQFVIGEPLWDSKGPAILGYNQRVREEKQLAEELKKSL